MTTDHQPKTDEEHVAAIRAAVNRLEEVCKAAIRHGLSVEIDIEDEEDDNDLHYPSFEMTVLREWQA